MIVSDVKPDSGGKDIPNWVEPDRAGAIQLLKVCEMCNIMCMCTYTNNLYMCTIHCVRTNDFVHRAHFRTCGVSWI
jgi:hypothetical protein